MPSSTFSSTVALRDECDLLGDQGDPGGERVARRAEAHRLAVQQQLAGVGRSAPAMILPSVDLPAPFSPTSPWTLAGVSETRGVDHSLDAAELFADAA